MQRIFMAAFWLAVAIVLYLTLRPLSDIPLVSDKTQHLVGFGILSALAALAYPRAGLLPLTAALSGLGGAIELIQPMFGRGDELLDWIADTAGVAIGIGLVWAGRRFKPRGA